MNPLSNFSQSMQNMGSKQLGLSSIKNMNMIKADNYSYLVIDSNDCIRKNGAIIATPSNFQTLINLQMAGIFRIGLSDVYYIYDTPNVNPRNNQFTITDNAATTQTFTIPEGYYQTYESLRAAIQLAITSMGGVWAGYTVTFITPTNQYVITSTAHPFTVTGTPQTELLAGIKRGTNPSIFGGGANTYKTLTPSLLYTRHFDILSSKLTQYTKGDQTSIGRNAALIVRNYTSSQPYSIFAPPTTISYNIPEVKYMKYDTSVDLSTVDIRLIDEFNQPLYYNPLIQQFSIVLVFIMQNNPDE